MNEKSHSSLLSENISEGVSTRDVAVAASQSLLPEDGEASSRSTKRQRTDSRLSLRKFFKAFKSYVLSSEDDVNLQCEYRKDHDYNTGDDDDRHPMFVIVDSRSVSSPSSTELLIEPSSNSKENILRRYLNKNDNLPSTSKGIGTEIMPALITNTVSREELQVVDINLQSENDILLDDSESDSESVVLSYLRNKDAFLDVEGTLLSSKKKSSLLEGVPKMETILEGEQLISLPFSANEELAPNLLKSKGLKKEISDTSLDVLIPSFPASPRSVSLAYTSSRSFDSRVEEVAIEGRNTVAYDQMRAVEFLHADNEFLIAAEIGNEKLIRLYISHGANVHAKDHLGRNALHLSVCSDNPAATQLLLDADVDCNVKDDIGMTPLYLCLFRRPCMTIAQMLFDHGAKIIERVSPMDTGLLIQFIMMCRPTEEEKSILCLLMSKGAIVNDPGAPGGRQALHFAAMSNNCELICLLLELGADSTLTNHRDMTAKEVALSFNCKEAAAILEEFERGIDAGISRMTLLKQTQNSIQRHSVSNDQLTQSDALQDVLEPNSDESKHSGKVVPKSDVA